MTALKMYHDSNCPYSRKVLIMASEHGLGDVFDFVSPFTLEGQKAIVRDNPLGKMPALVIAPGMAIFDSRSICRYVDAMRQDRPSLYPAQGMDCWRALRYESLGDGVLDSAVMLRLELNRPEASQMPERAEKQMIKIRAALDCLERESEYLEGPLTVGLIAVSNALSYFDFRWAHLEWRKGHPRLAQWQETMAVRPAFESHPYIESDLLLKKIAAGR